MEFSDTNKKQGLIQDITFLTGVDTDAFTIEDRTRNINQWYSQVASWIFETDGRWQWDDTNHTDRPMATTGLVSGQQEYQILSASPDSGKDFLQLERVEIISSDDIKKKLYPLDQKDIRGRSLEEFLDENGTPQYFDLRGSSIFLYPASDYDKSSGLRIYFKRSPLEFSSDDTTKEPGFAKPYHRILSLGASYDWAVAKNENNVNMLRQELEQYKKGLKDFYRNRDKYEKLKINRVYKSYR